MTTNTVTLDANDAGFLAVLAEAYCKEKNFHSAHLTDLIARLTATQAGC
jgi:1,2-phenylacetyl-CoA epoxidase catalytic subunit